ncbi:MAG: HYR domain-containing protein [Flavobacteriales bacterium]|nr:HYR domain-containing protein [Flavobacteriales bacterium]
MIINVLPVNDPPIAVDDNATTDNLTPVIINVPSNDFDIDGIIDLTTVTIVTPPSQGSVSVDPITGEITYTPNGSACTSDSFVYSICDDGSPVLCDQATVTISILDVQGPTVTNCPSNITVNNTPGICGASVTWVAPTVTDNCGGPVFTTTTHNPGTIFPVGTTTVTYSFMDLNGNMSVCTFNVTVLDVQPPIIVGCPLNIVLNNFESSCDNRATWVVPTALDNCPGVVMTATHFSGQNFPVGTTTVTYTATDAAGNVTTCSFDVTILDAENPIINGCPTDITVSADSGDCEATVSWIEPTATDNCGILSFTQSHVSGSTFPVGVTTVTYIAVDSVGNQTECTFDVIVTDNESPVISNCPTNITTTSNPGICGASVSWALPSVSDNCAGVISLTSNFSPGDIFPVGTTTVTYTATDAAGNVITCSFTVTVTDTESPSIVNCPGDIIVGNLFNTCYQQVYWPTIVASDNCGSTGLTITSSHTPGFIFPVGTTLVTYIVTDLAGNADTCTFNVIVEDVQPPTIQTCPSDVVINNTPGLCGANYTWATPSIFDNCPGVTITESHVSGSFFPLGTTSVSYIVTDAAGFSNACSFTVTVVDTEAPVFVSCPSNIVASVDSASCDAVVNWPLPNVTDNCGVASLVSSHNPGDVFPTGITTVTYTAVDTAGNVSTCSFTITVIENEAPVLSGCPTDIVVSNDSSACGAIVSWTPPTASDNCNLGFTFVSSHNPGDFFPVGTTLVTYTATDAAGNVSICSFNVTVNDTETPITVTCPTDITVNSTFNICGAAVSWPAPVFADNCSGFLVVSQTHFPGTVFPIGTTTVTYTATDPSGNTAVCSFTVTVNDTQLPQIIGCPQNLSVNNSNGLCGANVSWTIPSAIDNCPGVLLTSTHNSGDFFPIGSTTVTYTATDASNNIVTCSFTVTVTDSQAPIIFGCPSNIVVANDLDSCNAIVNWIAPTASDNCGLASFTSTHNSGDVFPVGVTTVVYTAVDSAGNVTNCSFTVTVTENQLPVILDCPTDIVVPNDSSLCGASVTWTPPTATDNCSIVTLTSNFNPGDFFPVGTSTVTYTATDAAGNIAQCSFTVTVNDVEFPAVTGCPTDTISVSATFFTCGATVSWVPPVFTDNCPGLTVTSTHIPGMGFPVGFTTVTYTGTDVQGNATTCSFVIEIVDTIPPVITVCPPNVTVSTSPVLCGANVFWPVPTVSDNCSGAILSATHNSGDFFPVGTTTVTYTATDLYGNVSTCSFNVTVVENVPPVISGCPSDISVSNDPDQCNAIVTWVAPTAFDNCGLASFTSTHNPGDVFPIGVTTVVYTAVDSAGNSVTCSFTVTVNDTQLPVIVDCPTNIVTSNDLGECGAEVSWIPPTASDNCNTGFTFVSTHNPGDFFPVGVTVVTYTATDASGNSAACSFTVTVNDSELPTTVSCPSDIIVSNNFNTCGASVSWPAPVFADNCQGFLIVTASHLPGTTFPIGTTTVTYTAVDPAGNTAICTFNVTVNDTQTPQIVSCPQNININTSNGVCGANVTWTLPSALDNCPGVSLTSTHNSGDFFPVGTTTVTYTATDASNNTVTCSFTVTVTDTQAPVISGCPTNIVVSNDPGVCEALVSWTVPSASDNCGLASFTSTHTPGTIFPVGTTTVTYTATDIYGNVSTCTFNVTVNDTEVPVLVGCPSDITLNNTPGLCGNNVTWTPPVFTDNCQGQSGLTVVSSHNPGDFFTAGTTVVTYTATDAAGNVTICSFNITVIDTEIPTITNCPSDITVNAAFNTCGAPVLWANPTITDNCQDLLNIQISHLPGTTFPVGTTTVTYTVTDPSGNVAACSFNITVIDTQIPTISSCPINVTLNSSPGLCGTSYNWVLPTAFDNCPGTTLTSNIAPGSFFPVGSTDVIYTATDLAGNTTNCTFTVIVNDVEAPVIVNGPANIIQSNNIGNCSAVVNWVAPQATDNCSIVSFTSDFASGSTFPVGTTTVTYTAVDQAGLITTYSFTVTVVDDEAPAVTDCPSDITEVSLPGICSAPVTWTPPTFTDNCGQGLVITSTHTSGEEFTVGTTTVTYTATDAAGNFATCSFVITVNDTEAPVITGCPSDINSCSSNVSWTEPVPSDNCGIVTFIASHTPGSSFPTGTTTVTYTATDAAGNVTVCSFNVTVSTPVLTPVFSNVSCNGASDGTATVIVNDAVGPFSFDWGTFGTDSLLTGLAPGTYPVTVTDALGCTASATITITEPEILAITVDLVNNGTCGYDNGFAQIFVTGGTEPYNFNWSNGQTSANLNAVGDGTYTLTVTDANGCIDTVSVIIDCVFGDVPNLVTPNGDGFNDKWVVPGLDKYPNHKVEIFNRWGNLVFKASPYQDNWEGYSEGMATIGNGRLPAGTYFYVIELEKNKVVSGYLELQY